MRIAIISDLTKWSWAGCEELWLALAQRALERGDQVSVYLLRDRVPPGKIQSLLDRGLDLHLPGLTAALVDGVRRISWKVAYALGPMGSSLKSLADNPPDVLFYSAGDAIPRRTVTRQITQRIPLPYPYVILCHNSHLFDRPLQGPDRDEAVRFYTGARVVLSVAERTNAEIEHLLATKLPRIAIVRNPVNIASTSAIPMPAGPAVGIASLGRLATNSKGQDMLLAALGASSMRQYDWRLSLYGEGPDANHLMRLAQHYGISNRVSIKGYGNDVRAIWAENHLLALPSRVESAPLVVVEAMLCGRPCIANDVGGVTDWITEPETGFVSPGLNIPSFRSALERAWSAKSDWSAIGMRAHDKAQKLIDPDPGGTILRILDEVAGKVQSRDIIQTVC